MPRTLARGTGLVFVHPYDDPARDRRPRHAGAGTAAGCAGPRRAGRFPVGGGGLLAGCATAATALQPGYHGLRRRGRGLSRHGAAAGRPAGLGRRPDHRRRHRRARCRRDAARQLFATWASRCWWCRNTRSRRRSACWRKAPRWSPKAPAPPASPRCWPIPSASPAERVGIGDHRRQHRRAHPVQRAAAQPAARWPAAAPASANPGPARRAGRHRRQDRRHGGNIIEVSHQRLFAASSVQAPSWR